MRRRRMWNSVSISGKPSFPQKWYKVNRRKVKFAAAEDNYDVGFGNKKAKEKKLQ